MPPPPSPLSGVGGLGETPEPSPPRTVQLYSCTHARPVFGFAQVGTQQRRGYSAPPDSVTVFVNGKETTVSKGVSVLQACEQAVRLGRRCSPSRNGGATWCQRVPSGAM
jgi:hypothetical protein